MDSTRRLPPLRPVDLDERQRQLYDRIVDGPRKSSNLVDSDGSLRGPFDPMLRSPDVGTPLQELGGALRFSTALAADVRELAILLSAAACRSAFEWSVHEPLAVAVGLPGDVIAAVHSGTPLRSADERYVIVARAAAEAFGECAVSATTFAELDRIFGDRRVFELLTIFGYYTTLALILNSYGIAE